MRAVLVPDFGVQNLQVRDCPDPVPAAGEVLVATEAATINPADVSVVTGRAASRIPPGAARPYTPGWDLAGAVVACADGADPALAGARVVGFSAWFVTGHGTQASMVALPADDVVPAPPGLPSTQLATVGLNGLTAWRGLDELHLAAGESIVITGAAGGVGGFAAALAASRGLTVIAAVRSKDRDDALALGATVAVSTDGGDLGAAVREVLPTGADALLDTASMAAAALGAVRDGGRYVTVTSVPQPERGITVTRVSARMDRDGLTTLMDMASTGRLHTPVAQVFELDEARAAYEAFSHPHGRGRIVLSVSR
jgi:NADPH2:quinone reductase